MVYSDKLVFHADRDGNTARCRTLPDSCPHGVPLSAAWVHAARQSTPPAPVPLRDSPGEVRLCFRVVMCRCALTLQPEQPKPGVSPELHTCCTVNEFITSRTAIRLLPAFLSSIYPSLLQHTSPFVFRGKHFTAFACPLQLQTDTGTVAARDSSHCLCFMR